MDTQLSPISAVNPGAVVTTSDSQVRQGFLGALAAALRTGNLATAGQALNGLRGAGGGISPTQLFNQIDSALSSGKASAVKEASVALDSFRSSLTSASSNEGKTPFAPANLTAAFTVEVKTPFVPPEPSADAISEVKTPFVPLNVTVNNELELQPLPGSGLGAFINLRA
jgi:hypothetical protein